MVIGARNSGKTNLSQYLLLNPTDENNEGLGTQSDVILVFGNGASYLQWTWLKSPHKAYPSLREDVIQNCFKINETRLQKRKPAIRFLLIFDDSLTVRTKNSDILTRLFTHGRIYNIAPLIINQSIFHCNPDWRSNTDYFFFFKPRTKREIDFIHDNLLTGTRKESEALLNSLEKHQCLMIDYCSGSTKVSKLKAPLISIKE